jgi:preprotein translocase subunit YajC
MAAFLHQGAPAAGGAAPAAAGGGGPLGGCAGGGIQPLVMMALMFGVFYFLMIRPQQKKTREHANMLNGLQKGDEVVTRGGIIGKVSGVQDSVVVLELQEKVRVRVFKSYIESKTPQSAAASTASGSAAESKN